MNEAETRAELIDPKLAANGWVSGGDIKVHREHLITHGKIMVGGRRKAPLKADYVLQYKGRKLAVIEAKSDEQDVSEGVAQAKDYATKMELETAYAANGRQIYYMCMDTAKENLVNDFLTPEELWHKTFPAKNKWEAGFDEQPFETRTKTPYFYQETAIERVLDAIANKQNRILLTLATGTGKTFIAFQIAWKLFKTRWNLQYDGTRQPRILFLADRNILANQAFNAFSDFPEDALVRIKPSEIKKRGSVPTNGSIFFTIFQTFMSGPNDTPYFGEYPPDYFDLIIIDECHRGGANDESNWRGILEYFKPAVQLGLTATPKRQENADTYAYFGKPVYIYSLKAGINDGFLTPYKVRKIKTSLDEYTYEEGDEIVEGAEALELGKTYTENDFNYTIEMLQRERERVRIFMNEIDQNEKTLVFCRTQQHAAYVRDYINQIKKSTEPNYCVRVTANDGELGEQYLREFQNNDKSVPTILTTSYKLSTGVDARNIRNIVLLRPVNNIIEFKQIMGRGTRMFEGKDYFTVYDFVKAYEHFKDPEWDGEPEDPVPTDPRPPKKPIDAGEPDEAYCTDEGEGQRKRKMIKIKLRDGKEHEITHTIETAFFDADGKPISMQEFLDSLFGKFPELFNSEAELRRIWSDPITRKTLLVQLEEAGFDKDQLSNLQKAVDAERSDLFDVLELISFAVAPITRDERVNISKPEIMKGLNAEQREFIDFVLSKYIETGVEELDQEKLPALLQLKYHSVNDALDVLGDADDIRETFIRFQKFLYERRA